MLNFLRGLVRKKADIAPAQLSIINYQLYILPSALVAGCPIGVEGEGESAAVLPELACANNAGDGGL